MDRVYMTREGYEKLIEELEYLRNVKRKEIAKMMEHARSLGDLSENAEFDAAKEALSQNEQRIKEFEDRLSRVEIVDATMVVSDKIHIGVKVTLFDLEFNEEVEYTLVGQDEANALTGSISVTSPVGKALLGHAENEIVEISVPAGILRYKILKITR